MADLPIPKKGEKPHPMQKHLDTAKESLSVIDQHFRNQMSAHAEAEAEADQQRKADRGGVSPLGGLAK